MEIVTSWMEEGIEKGIAQGREEGREIGRREGVAHTLLRQLAQRFGPVPVDLVGRVTALPDDALDLLVEDLLGLSSLAELERWLATEQG